MLSTLHLTRKNAKNKLTCFAKYNQLHHLKIKNVNYIVVQLYFYPYFYIYNLYTKNNKNYLYSLIVTHKNYNN